MSEFLQDNYMLLKGLHVIAVIAWLAGMLYLPRLFVYHADVPVGSERDRMLQVMERRLLRFIINPAMAVVWILGLTLATVGSFWSSPWFHIKLTLVIALSGLHGALSAWRKKFEKGENTKSANFYRIINEVPTVLMILIVLAVYLKPFA